MSEHVVVIGGGHGGDAVVGSLRQAGFGGRITLIGDEGLAPYHRPPLSKAWLSGEADSQSLAFRGPDYHAKSAIDLMLGARVTRIERGARQILLEDGRAVGWERLVLATGARPRPLAVSGAEAESVLMLRNAADADRLKAALGAAGTIAIVGGGYIGLEVAASARKLGVAAVVIEREARLLARVASPELSAFYAAAHEAHGVRIMLGAEVEGFETRDGRVSGVVLRDGSVISCDVALVGVGAIPNDGIAREAGLLCDAGVVVDLDGRTSDPNIFAVGDVTYRPLPHYDRMGRVESVPNAGEQARRVAAAIVGIPAPHHEVPWFWSDQYDLKLQIAGLALDATERLVRGDPASERFAVFHLRDGRVRVVEAVNAVSEFVVGRKLIGAGKAVDTDRLRDASVPMKTLA